jgi:hypothetical protein
MKKILILILAVILAGPWMASSGGAQMVTKEEALALSNSWVDFIIRQEGQWGAAKTAEVIDVQEFKRGERILGYFCPVHPRGFIVVSLRRELVPVKASSEICNLNPRAETGLADFIKDGIERTLDDIEHALGPLGKVPSEELVGAGFTDYRPVWEDLERYETKINYQAGEILLTSAWGQYQPYNVQCPAPPPGHECARPNCSVGCVAVAGAQIMRYWCWPPYGIDQPYDDPYDWPNMPDSLTDSSTPAETSAVAELCYEVGLAVGVRWCDGEDVACHSPVSTDEMISVYKDVYHYSNDCAKRLRFLSSNEMWFDLMKVDLNINRPIQYRVVNHSTVADGWRLWGDPPVQHVHMNYGWAEADSYSTWYSLDELVYGEEDEEYMLVGIYPSKSFHDVMSGNYPREPALPFRYFDRDVTGGPAIIENGQGLQFLPNISVTCTIDSVLIYGSPPDTLRSRLFTRGDQSRGVLISNGAVKMKPTGSIRFF